jgi:tetratricopeptide (TPR) repeat protein
VNNESALHHAQMLIDAQRPLDARRTLEPYLTQNPNSVEALLILATANVNLTQLPEALAAAQRALQISPSSVVGWQIYSGVLSQMGEHPQAIAAAEYAVQLAPSDPWSHFRLAGADLMAGQVSQRTKDEARAAVQLAPESPIMHLIVGDVAVAMNDLSTAAAAFEQALRIEPLNATARNNLTAITRRTTPAAAAATFMNLLAEDPQSEIAKYNLKSAIVSTVARLHLVLAAVWVAAAIGYNERFTGGAADPEYGQTLRWILLALACVGVTINLYRVRAQSGGRFRQLARSSTRFGLRLRVWMIALAAAFTMVVSAAFLSNPYFRIAYFVCLIALLTGAVMLSRIKLELKRELRAIPDSYEIP